MLAEYAAYFNLLTVSQPKSKKNEVHCVIRCIISIKHFLPGMCIVYLAHEYSGLSADRVSVIMSEL